MITHPTQWRLDTSSSRTLTFRYGQTSPTIVASPGVSMDSYLSFGTTFRGNCPSVSTIDTTYYFPGGYCQPIINSGSSTYSPNLAILVPVTSSSIGYSGYYFSGDFEISIQCYPKWNNSSSTSLFCPFKAGLSSGSISSTSPPLRIHVSMFVPTGVCSSVSIPITGLSSTYSSFSSPSGEDWGDGKYRFYDMFFVSVKCTNCQFIQYPSGYTDGKDAYTTITSSSGLSTDYDSDPVTPPSTGGDSSVDLTETNQKIDAVGEKVDGVKDAVDSATSAIQEGNQQASQERQGILQAILNLPQTILDGVVHLFVPNQEDIMEVKQAYDDLLEDRFGFFAQAGTLLVSLFTGIASSLNSGSSYSFQFPGITLPFNGTNYVIVEAQAVSLDNAFMSVCRPVLGTGVTIIACCALINTLIRFFEVIIGDKFDNTLRGG